MTEQENLELTQIETISITLQELLKKSSLSVREALKVNGFSRSSRITNQRLLYLLVEAIRKTRAMKS